jgi:bifunctional non-homologous end joining protein LigD
VREDCLAAREVSAGIAASRRLPQPARRSRTQNVPYSEETRSGEKDWMIHRMDPPTDPTAQEMPEFVEPMLARASTLPAQGSGWAYEIKWDGIRAIVHSQPGRIKLLSRKGNDVTGAYPELRALNRALSSHTAILDGEIVAFDQVGRPTFEALQPRMHVRGAAAVRRLAQTTPVTYVLFDLLWLDGHSLMDLPYAERRARLDDLELNGERWRTPAFRAGEGSTLLAATRAQGLEGVIAKRLNSRYAPGRRDGDWLKVRHSQRQELVIGGWTEGKGSRAARIGALHLGVYDEQGRRLSYAGRVGTGFEEEELERLAGLLGPLAQGDSPFTGRQPAKGAHFARPQLVCEVEFTEWTRDGRLRHPSYKGLREDKPATAVVRERVQPPPLESPATPAPPPKSPTTPAPPLKSAVTPTPPRQSPASQASKKPSGERSQTYEEGSANVKTPTQGGRRVRGGVQVTVDGRALRLTNLEKALYPKTGFTKGQMVGYYATIAPALLPHLRGRPLTLKRYPDGVEGEHFYEKQCPDHRPEWVQTTAVWSGRNEREIDYCLCEELPTLVWLANLAAVELHPSLARAEAIRRPTTLAFDLDPGPPAGIVDCCEVALELHEMFAQLGMQTLAKTSGATGLQVYVPLNDEDVTYAQTKPFAHAVADLLEHRRPERVVSRMAKAQRPGKVLIDWSQNDEHKTTVSVYSLRARDSPTVSTPVTWEELRTCRDTGDPALLEFNPEGVLERVRERGDLFAEVISLHQSLPALGG